jgi:SPP1 gp7 family putative phage head morphogenesis protein
MSFLASRESIRQYMRQQLIEKRRKMSKKARRRNPSGKRGAWVYPIKVERSYYTFIRGIMREFSALMIPRIRANLKAWIAESNTFDSSEREFYDAYVDEFEQLMGEARELQNEFFEQGLEATSANVLGFGEAANTANAIQWGRVTSLAIGTAFDVDSGWVEPLLRSWTNTNFVLIKSLSEEYIKKVNTIVATGVQSGALYSDVMGQLRAMDSNMTKARAELIARDQIGTLNASLTKGRIQDAGIDSYIWSTALDERVRPSHRKMSGSFNRWAEPNKYKPRGDKNYKNRPPEMNGATPGSQIQCRCTALPGFDDLIADVDAQIEKEEALNPAIRG